MYNQHNVKFLEKLTVFGDMEVQERIVKKDSQNKNRTYYKVQCLVCRRTKDMEKKYLLSGVGISHQFCSNSLEPYSPRFYRIWQAMRTRTTNPNAKGYKEKYKDISSEDYKFFIDFYDDMYTKYLEHVFSYGESNTSIDRIDNNGNYTKDNIRWATHKIQTVNSSHVKRCIAISPNGKVYEFDNQSDFAKEHGIHKGCLNGCLRGRKKHYKGWKFYYKDANM